MYMQLNIHDIVCCIIEKYVDICIYIGTWSLYSIYVRTCTYEADHFSLKKGKLSQVLLCCVVCHLHWFFTFLFTCSIHVNVSIYIL